MAEKKLDIYKKALEKNKTPIWTDKGPIYVDLSYNDPYKVLDSKELGKRYNDMRFAPKDAYTDAEVNQVTTTRMKNIGQEFGTDVLYDALWQLAFSAFGYLIGKVGPIAAEKMGLKNAKKLISNINKKCLKLNKVERDSFSKVFPPETDEYKLMDAVIKELDKRLSIYDKIGPASRENIIRQLKEGTLSKEDAYRLIGEISSNEYANTHSVIDGFSKKGEEYPVFHEITDTVKKPLVKTDRTIASYAAEVASEDGPLSDTLLHVIEFFDPEDTFSHSYRVKQFTIDLLQKPVVKDALIKEGIVLTPEEIQKLGEAFQLHDLGKVKLRLSDLLEKWQMPSWKKENIKEHEAFTRDLLGLFDEYNQEVSDQIKETIEEIAGNHHNYSKTQTSLLDKILKAADGVDGMRSERIYKRANTPEKIEDILYKYNTNEWGEVPEEIKDAAIEMTKTGEWDKYGYRTSPLTDIRENMRIDNYQNAIDTVAKEKYSGIANAAKSIAPKATLIAPVIYKKDVYSDPIADMMKNEAIKSIEKHSARKEAYDAVNKLYPSTLGLKSRKTLGFLGNLTHTNPWHYSAEASKQEKGQGIDSFQKFVDNITDDNVKQAANIVLGRWDLLSEDDREYFKDVFSKYNQDVINSTDYKSTWQY